MAQQVRSSSQIRSGSHSGFLHTARILLILLILLASFASPVKAGPVPVGEVRYVDAVEGEDTGDCTVTPCASLQYAADQSNSGDTVMIGEGLFSGAAISSKNLTITGAGMDLTVLDMGNAGIVLKLFFGTFNLNDLTVQHGNSPVDKIVADRFYAGGIYIIESTVIISRVKVTSNIGADYGGGIYGSNSTITINDSVISDNTASYGGGINTFDLTPSRSLTLNRVTLSGNNATVSSGAIHFSQNTLELTNVTISGNTSNQVSGLEVASGSASLVNVTVTNNTSTIDKAVMTSKGSISFKNTIVYNNPGGDCRRANPAYAWVSNGNNLEGQSQCMFTSTGDQQNTNPLLAALADNGGYSFTHALLAGSPAINGGSNTGCPSTDQRGITRPQGSSCDIGAYEVQAAGAFNKTSPADDAVNQPAWLILTWEVSEHASYYEYCMGTCLTWYYVGSDPYISLGPLTPNLTYSWQVRAHNDAGNTYANGTTDLWSFTTGMIPAAFSKTSPVDGASNQSIDPTLSWAASTGATSYQYCIGEEATCEDWVDNGASTSVALSGLDFATTYHWQVRARSDWGDTLANDGTAWGFTTAVLPQVTGLNPPTAIAGSPALTLIVNGSNFLAGDIVYWNDSPLATTFISPTSLSTTIPSGEIDTVAEVKVRVIRPGFEAYPSNNLDFKVYTFTDVLPTNTHWRNIEGLYAQGITGGCEISPVLKYCPNNKVTRQQMAVFLLRSMFGKDYIPPVATGIFMDVPLSSSYAPWIEALYHQGVTGGCSLSPLMYCPEKSVTRGQMAVFLLRAKEGSAYTPPPATGIFTDVPVSSLTAPWIEELYTRDITGGCTTTPLNYCPANPVTRGQMGTFIVRMFEFDPLPEIN